MMKIENELITTLKRCNDRQLSVITVKEAFNYIEKSNELRLKIEKIRSSHNDNERRQAKTSLLPAFVFTGTFKESVKKDSFSEPSGLVCVDIDHIGNVHSAKLIISKIPFVVGCFISPSGDGVKAVIRITKDLIKTDIDLKKAFPSIKALFLSYGFHIDEARKDISGLCFASYDPEIYINYDAECLYPQYEDNYPIKKNTYNGTKCDLYLDKVQRILLEALPGTRHAARLRAAKLAGGYIAGGLVDEGEVRAILLMASDRISDNGKTPEGEIKTIIDGIDYGKKEPIQKKNYDFSDSPWLNADILSDHAKAPSYLINNIIESKTHGLIAGSSQSFKSFCVLKMAHSICTGKDFFGHEVFDTGKVLYICGEGLGALGRRIKALKIVEGGFNDNFFVLNRPLFIDNIAEMDWLKKAIDEIKPVFVGFDTFSSLATSTKENVNEEVARVLRMVSDCCFDVGASSIVVHHYGKDAEKGSRGASSFSANVDYEIGMTRGDGFNAVMSCKKSKDGDFFEPIDIIARVVDLGLKRQDGSYTSSLVLKKSESHQMISEKQENAINAIKLLIIEYGALVDGVRVVTEKQIRECLNKLFEKDGNNKYMNTSRMIKLLTSKMILIWKNDRFYIG